MKVRKQLDELRQNLSVKTAESAPCLLDQIPIGNIKSNDKSRVIYYFQQILIQARQKFDEVVAQNKKLRDEMEKEVLGVIDNPQKYFPDMTPEERIVVVKAFQQVFYPNDNKGGDNQK